MDFTKSNDVMKLYLVEIAVDGIENGVDADEFAADAKDKTRKYIALNVYNCKPEDIGYPYKEDNLKRFYNKVGNTYEKAKDTCNVFRDYVANKYDNFKERLGRVPYSFKELGVKLIDKIKEQMTNFKDAVGNKVKDVFAPKEQQTRQRKAESEADPVGAWLKNFDNERRNMVVFLISNQMDLDKVMQLEGKDFKTFVLKDNKLIEQPTTAIKSKAPTKAKAPVAASVAATNTQSRQARRAQTIKDTLQENFDDMKYAAITRQANSEKNAAKVMQMEGRNISYHLDVPRSSQHASPETSVAKFYYDNYSGYLPTLFPDDAYRSVDWRFGDKATYVPHWDENLSAEANREILARDFRNGHPITDDRITLEDIAKRVAATGSVHSERDKDASGNVIGIANVDENSLRMGIAEAYHLMPDEVRKGSPTLAKAIAEHERQKQPQQARQQQSRVQQPQAPKRPVQPQPTKQQAQPYQLQRKTWREADSMIEAMNANSEELESDFVF